MSSRHLLTGLLAAGLLCTSALLAGDPPKLSAGKGGITIAGSTGSLTLGVPTQINKEKDKATQKATVTVDGNTITANYPGGGVLTMKVSNADHAVQCNFSGFPAGVTGLTFNTSVPMNYKDGGQFGFGDDALQPFPATFGKQIHAQGNYKKFTIVDALGEGYSMTMPGSYQQIQDHRAFKTEVFSHIIFYNWGNSGNQPFKFTFSGYTAPAGSEPALKFLVDRYGQSARKDYPGKVTGDAELKADGDRQLAEPYTPDPKLDTYGGLAGSGAEYGLAKTGFFHAGKIKDRLVLVTPEGNMFFQLGMCGIASTDDNTLVKGREKTYEWLPAANDPVFATAWRPNTPGVISFYNANLIRKFGKPFDINEWSGQVITRLRQWGFNSSGAFSTRTAKYQEMNFPTVYFLPTVKSMCLPDKVGADEVMDPFTPGIAEALDTAFAKGVAPKADDPLLIGYFQGNEQHFEDLPKTIPGYKASKVPAKAKLIEVLKAKYGDIAKFNAAWDPATPLANWDAAAEEALFIRSDEAAADMKSFFRLYLEAYYSLVESTFRKYDHNHLLIGSRWTPNTAGNEDTVRIGSKHLDVISINYYTDGIEKAFLDKVFAWSGGKAMIFSEWHYGADDQGLAVHKEVKDQDARAKAYRNYIEQSAALPYVVGSQWFIYGDQSITGRFFSGFHGEGNNTGFVNVVDRPYEPLVAAAKLTHSRIYDLMLGKVEPYLYDDPRFNGKGGEVANRTKVAVRALPGVKLDGTTTNWPGVPGESIEPNRLIIGKPNPDLRADFRVCWDETNLYFFIQVKDKTPMMNEKAATSLWSADGIELFIGHRDLATPGNLTFSDRQVFLGAGKEAKVHILDHPDAAKNIQTVVSKDVSGDGYVLEAFIPWTALEITPKPGQELLFDIAVDYSENGQDRTHQLAWNSTGNISKERGSWGKLRLE